MRCHRVAAILDLRQLSTATRALQAPARRPSLQQRWCSEGPTPSDPPAPRQRRLSVVKRKKKPKPQTPQHPEGGTDPRSYTGASFFDETRWDGAAQPADTPQAWPAQGAPLREDEEHTPYTASTAERWTAPTAQPRYEEPEVSPPKAKKGRGLRRRRKLTTAGIEELSPTRLHGPQPGDEMGELSDQGGLPEWDEEGGHDEEGDTVHREGQSLREVEAAMHDSPHGVHGEGGFEEEHSQYGVVPAHRLLMPSIDGDSSEPATTRLSLNQLDFSQRERLRKLLSVSSIVTGPGEEPWSDFHMINHLSQREWCLETDRFNYLGKSVAERFISEAFLTYSMEQRLQWVQHCEPVTFEVSRNSAFADSPNLGGAFGLRNDYDRSTAHEPGVSAALSYVHAKQIEAVFLNSGNLTLIATQLGLQGLMNADALQTLSDYTPAERMNPALMIDTVQLTNKGPSLHNTNLRRISSEEVGQKVLALIGSVRSARGAPKAKRLAEHIFLGDHVAEDVLQNRKTSASPDLIELAVASLDEQVLKTTPSKVLASLYTHMNVQVDWKTEVTEIETDEDERRELLSVVRDANAVADSAQENLIKMKETGKAVSDIQKAMDAAKAARKPKQVEEPAEDPAKGGAHSSLLEQMPKGKADDDESKEIEPVDDNRPLVEVSDDDEYTLQFDAEGKPIDIRQTSLTYPVEPGPHQSETPLSEAPMYEVPKADAPLIERLHWKNRMKLERERARLQMESVFQSIMRPRKLFYKTIMVDKRTGQILGIGKSRSVATARVDAQLDAVKRIRANLLSLQRTVHDIQS